MSLPPQRQLDNYLSQFAEKQVDGKYLGLYDGERRFGRVFAWLHEQYNGAFEFMNAKAPQGVGGHFNADPSRDLMEVNETYSALQGRDTDQDQARIPKGDRQLPRMAPTYSRESHPGGAHADRGRILRHGVRDGG